MTDIRPRALVVVAAVLTVIAACGLERQPAASRDEPSAREPTVPLKPHERFVPATYREGDKVVMRVTFPDGTRAEVLYPPRLRLAERGVRPYSSGGFPGCPESCFRDFVVLRGDAHFRDGRRLERRYEGAGRSTVDLWEAVRGETEPARYLVFRFGRWYVGVWDDHMSDEELGIWARSLVGRVTRDGFLVLGAKPPLRLARFGEHAGPELMLDDISVVLKPGWGCDRPRDREPEVSGEFASWCLPEPGPDAVAVHANAGRRFTRALLAGLEIRNVRRAR